MYGKNPRRPFKVNIFYVDPDTEQTLCDIQIYPEKDDMEDIIKRVYRDYKDAKEKQSAIQEMYNPENVLDHPELSTG